LNSTAKEQHLSAPRIREISSNVGFVSLPDQVRRRAIKKGFEFNLMVVGLYFFFFFAIPKREFIYFIFVKVNLV